MCFSGLIEKTSSSDKLGVHTFKCINNTSVRNLCTIVLVLLVPNYVRIFLKGTGMVKPLSDKLSTQPTLCQMI